jgi:hypothetical protein
VNWEVLSEVHVTDRGHFADPDKKALFSAAQKVKHLTPAIGTELLGVDLRQLTNQQKDELWVLHPQLQLCFDGVILPVPFLLRREASFVSKPESHS